MVSGIKELDNIMTTYNNDAHQMEGENRILRDTVTQLKNELCKLKEPALMVCEVVDVMKDRAIVKTPNGNRFFVNIASDCEDVFCGDSVLTEQKNLCVLGKIPTSKKYSVEQFVIIEKPSISWSHVGGLDRQIQELKEVIELPLKRPELFRAIGIQPPKGILLHGPPGTGKTLLAKAVAASTKSTFIEIVGSELVQKFIGEGAKLVKEVFELAREKAPSIVFVDEMDAIAAKRIELGTSGEREVQRTFMQFLAELDGFKPLDNVKLIGCTNRKDVLDPAIMRPGRFDRLIEVPVPDPDGIEEIFSIHTKSMPLHNDVMAQSLCKHMDGFTGAEIKSVATEAGYFAIRGTRKTVTHTDFMHAVKKIKDKESSDKTFMKMFG